MCEPNQHNYVDVERYSNYKWLRRLVQHCTKCADVKIFEEAPQPKEKS